MSESHALVAAKNRRTTTIALIVNYPDYREVICYSRVSILRFTNRRIWGSNADAMRLPSLWSPHHLFNTLILPQSVAPGKDTCMFVPYTLLDN